MSASLMTLQPALKIKSLYLSHGSPVRRKKETHLLVRTQTHYLLLIPLVLMLTQLLSNSIHVFRQLHAKRACFKQDFVIDSTFFQFTTVVFHQKKEW